LEDLGKEGSIILRWIFRKWDVGADNAVMILWVPQNAGNLTSLKPVRS
jgi:hypothetical protein